MKRIITLIILGILISVSCTPTSLVQPVPKVSITFKNSIDVPDGIFISEYLIIAGLEIWDYGDSQTLPVYTCPETISPNTSMSDTVPAGMHYIKIDTLEGVTKISSAFNLEEGESYNINIFGCYGIYDNTSAIYNHTVKITVTKQQ